MDQSFFYPATAADLNRIEWNGEPVLTTAQLAFKFECNVKNLRMNFKNNENRFVEGKHFYKLEGDALKQFKIDTNDEAKSFGVAPSVNVLYLWTQRGAARHAKMLNNDTAWEIYELLEDTYFKQAEKKDAVTGEVVSDFQRGVELGKLAPHAKDPLAKATIVAKAANLILGYDFLELPTAPKQLTLNF